MEAPPDLLRQLQRCSGQSATGYGTPAIGSESRDHRGQARTVSGGARNLGVAAGDGGASGGGRGRERWREGEWEGGRSREGERGGAEAERSSERDQDGAGGFGGRRRGTPPASRGYEPHRGSHGDERGGGYERVAGRGRGDGPTVGEAGEAGRRYAPPPIAPPPSTNPLTADSHGEERGGVYGRGRGDGPAGEVGRRTAERNAPLPPPPATDPRNASASEGCRFWGLRFMVQGSGFRVQGSGFRVLGSGFRVASASADPPTRNASVHGAGSQIQDAPTSYHRTTTLGSYRNIFGERQRVRRLFAPGF